MNVCHYNCLLLMHLQSKISKDWSFQQANQFIQLDQKFDIDIFPHQRLNHSTCMLVCLPSKIKDDQ